MSHRHSALFRTRQNHAIEHATLHTASKSGIRFRLAGVSYWGGFFLIGNASTSFIRSCATLGLNDMQLGNSALAVHRRCGTNLATGITIASLGFSASWLIPKKPFWQILGSLASLLTAIYATPGAGILVQEHITTTSDVYNASISDISRLQFGKLVIHHIRTEMHQ